MPSIIYPAKIKGSELRSNLIEDIYPTAANNPFKNNETLDILEHVTDPKSLTDGWDYPQLFSQSDTSVTFNNSTRISNHKRIIPTLNGPVIVASNEVRVDSDDFVNYIGEVPVMGVKSSGSNANARAFIFNRSNERISIAKEFQYAHINAIEDKLLPDQFTEVSNEGQDFFVFQMEAPLSVSRLNGSSLQLDIVDYLKTSFDYNHVLTKYGIQEDQFLKMCDYVSILREDFKDADEEVYEWVFEDAGMTIHTDYFPIYTHITIIARYVHNEVDYSEPVDGGDEIYVIGRRSTEYLYQLGPSFYDDVDPISGTIKIQPDFIDSAIGTLYGFYIFYGIAPSIYINPEDPVIELDEILEENKDLSYIGINDKDNYGNMSIDNDLIHITNDVIPTSETTDVIMPFRYKKFFLEPSSNIYINNEYIKRGKKIWIDNEGVNKIQFTAPVHIIEMIEPVMMDGTTINTGNNISDIAAVYGVFRHGNNVRATLASVTAFDTTAGEDMASVAQGYGEGPYGAGGYGQGRIETYGTGLYYTSGGQIIDPKVTSVGVQIRPIDMGYEIVLPAWAVESSILVQEVTEKSATVFKNWEFINPDILVLDKNTAHDYAYYNITYDLSVYPIISGMDLENHTITMNVLHDPQAIYSNFAGYYLLHSKKIKVKIGYVDDQGNRQYFPNELTVNMVLEEGYLQRTVTGTKTILL
ncbi:MAG: hypothetical protein DRQ78_00145 [Epsilonproteobacteria bacterium]|nr:MAG: hypothetical protein DRQ78_00145 [Campylobacterota bacterium]